MTFRLKKSSWYSYFLIVFGSFLMAASVNTFAIPNHLGEGGVPGMTMIFYYLFSIPTSITNFLLNGFLLIVGLKILDKETIFKTLVAILINSFALHLLKPYQVIFKDAFLAPLVAGGLMGLGIGLIYQGKGTAAGGTIIARILEVKTGLPKSKGILITDLSVIIPSIFIIGFEPGLLTIVSVYFGSKIIALVSEGAEPKKSLMVISPFIYDISKTLEKNLQRNGTFVKGTGSFSLEEQDILYVVIEGTEILKARELIQQVDEEAFIVISDVKDVSGKRFYL